MRLPDFICVGPGRTGTTWLHAALTGHVGLPWGVKETRFWGQYYYKGIEWYADHFRHCDRSLPVGEACPYFATPQARERIWKHLPQCKIIVTLREPVDRSYSQYRALCKMGLIHGSFEEALNHPRIAETNRYAFHLSEWVRLYGENLKVLLFDDLQRDPQGFLDRVCDFIGIRHIALEGKRIRTGDINSYRYLPRTRRISRRVGRVMNLMHEKRAYRVMNFLDRIGFWEFWLTGRKTFAPLGPEAAARIREQFLPEVDAVERITGFDLNHWRQPSSALNRWLEATPPPMRPSHRPGTREMAAIILALIPLATGAVPDGLDLATMRFAPRVAASALETDGDDYDDGGGAALA